MQRLARLCALLLLGALLPGCATALSQERRDYILAHPHGEELPYAVDSGFRFPVPVGDVELYVSYSGCDIEEGKPANRETGIVVNIEEGTALEVAFDGQSLVAGVASPDTKVTLEDIYEAVTGSRSVE